MGAKWEQTVTWSRLVGGIGASVDGGFWVSIWRLKPVETEDSDTHGLSATELSPRGDLDFL